MPFSQVKMGLAVVLLLAAFADRASCSFSMTKVIPVKPGEMNQTFVVNVPPTVDRTEYRGNDTSAQFVLPPLTQAPAGGGDCLLSACDENDVGCDGLPPCGPYCPQEACSRGVNCSQCWQAGFSGPCCWSCCSQYLPSANNYQLPPTAPQQRQQPAFSPFPPPEAIPLPQAQPLPIPQLRPFPIPQSQAVPIQPLGPFQPRPIPIPQAQPIPFAQSQPIPFAQPQPIPFAQPQTFAFAQSQPMLVPQPRPIPIPVSVPYARSQPIPYAQFQPQPQSLPRVQYQPQAFSYSPNCRQTSSWPFMQCVPSYGCPPYQPGCVQQPISPNWCYSIGLC